MDSQHLYIEVHPYKILSISISPIEMFKWFDCHKRVHAISEVPQFLLNASYLNGNEEYKWFNFMEIDSDGFEILLLMKDK